MSVAVNFWFDMAFGGPYYPMMSLLRNLAVPQPSLAAALRREAAEAAKLASKLEFSFRWLTSPSVRFRNCQPHAASPGPRRFLGAVTCVAVASLPLASLQKRDVYTLYLN